MTELARVDLGGQVQRVRTLDVSEVAVALVIPDAPTKLKKREVRLELRLDEPLFCKGQVTHVRQQDDTRVYVVTFAALSDEQTHALRDFVDCRRSLSARIRQRDLFKQSATSGVAPIMLADEARPSALKRAIQRWFRGRQPAPKPEVLPSEFTSKVQEVGESAEAMLRDILGENYTGGKPRKAA